MRPFLRDVGGWPETILIGVALWTVILVEMGLTFSALFSKIILALLNSLDQA